MSSRSETAMHTTGAHRAHRSTGKRAAPRPAQRGAPAFYEAHLDGLFTYCLSVLCDHDTATAALGDALVLAERRVAHSPVAEGERRAWLYALARWSCLRQLAQSTRHRAAPAGSHTSSRRSGSDGPAARTAPSGRSAAQGRAAKRSAVQNRATRRSAAQGSAAERPAAPGGPAAESSVPGRAVTWEEVTVGGDDDARGTGPGAPPGADGAGAGRSDPSTGAADAPETERSRRQELALLAWPEAAGTSPEQREALELAVRHRLATPQIASVLGLDAHAARELLASAACEVERTRTALAVVELGGCPGVGRLTGDHRLLLGPTLRDELVRHVDNCPHCRRTAERAASGTWPGTTVTPDTLPVLEAPRTAVRLAMTRSTARARGAGPSFDRRGFPMGPRDHAARRERLRARAVTTTVVATVIAAPVLALWAAYRGAPVTGEGRDPAVTAQGPDGHGRLDAGREGAYENAGSAAQDARFTDDGPPAVSVEVVDPGAAATKGGSGAGGLTVEAQPMGRATAITLTASGDEPVHWSARTGASWLRLSRASGTLRPGDSFTLYVYVDRGQQPRGPWQARLSFAPSGAVVVVEGQGRRRPPHQHRPHPRPTRTLPPPPADPTPSAPPPVDPGDPPSGGGDPTPPPPSDPPPPPAEQPTPPPADGTGP